MDDVPLDKLGIALAVLLAIAGFFSIAETAMMAVNRYRLRHRAQRGERGARLAMALLDKTDTLLGVILLGMLSSGLSLMGVEAFWQEISQGIALLLAVVIDDVRRRRVEVRG